MASRDLTATFIERRTAANVRRRTSSKSGSTSRLSPFGLSKKSSVDDDHLLIEEGFPPMSSPLDKGTGNAPVPPQWVDEVDSIHSNLEEIVRQMSQLNSLHATRLGSVFGKDLDNMEGEIESLTRDITNRFRTCESILKRVGNATKRGGGEEATIGANIQRSLAKKLQELSVQFRQKQRKYLSDVQIQKSGGVMDSENKFGIDLNSSGHDGFSTQQMTVVDDLTLQVQSRDQEISKIAQSIEELGSIFKELAVLVIDQGTILDRIDYNMEAVVEHTREGIQQLEKAEKHQKSARPLKCIIFLLALIGLLLLILIWKHRRRHPN